VMGTSCQAGERNAEGQADPPSRGFGAARSRGQRTEAGGRWGICQHSVPKARIPVFVFAPVTLSKHSRQPPIRVKAYFQTASLVITLFVGILLCGCRTRPICILVPVPYAFSPADVAGEWIGFTTSGTDLYRLELGVGQSGLLTEAYTALTNAEVMRFEISRWDITTNNVLTCAFLQRDANDPLRKSWPLKMECDVKGDHLEAILTNGKGGWERSIIFWREKDLEQKLKVLRQ